MAFIRLEISLLKISAKGQEVLLLQDLEDNLTVRHYPNMKWIDQVQGNEITMKFNTMSNYSSDKIISHTYLKFKFLKLNPLLWIFDLKF